MDDELYSMMYAHYYTNATPDASYLNNSDFWLIGEWMDSDILKSVYIVGKEESVFSRPLSEYILKFVTKRNYFGLLNGAESIISPGIQSKMPGVVLNIIIFVLLQMMLYEWCKKLKISDTCIILVLFMFGFSGMFIGLVTYVRFYMWVFLLQTCVTVLHLEMWISDSIIQFIINELVSALLIWLAYLNSELILIWIGPLVLCYSFGLLINKKFLKVGLYFLPLSVGGVCFLVQSSFWSAITHPEEYVYAGGTLQQIGKGLYEFSFIRTWEYLQKFLAWTGQYLFGCIAIMVLFLFSVLSVCLYLFFIKKTEYRPGLMSGFMIVLMMVDIIYLFLAAVTILYLPYYISYAYPSILVGIGMIFDRGSKYLHKNVKKIYIALSFLALVSTFYFRNVDWLFTEDKVVLTRLNDYQDMDSILIAEIEDRHETQDCVAWCGEGTKVLNITSYNNQINDCPGNVLLWVRKGKDYQPFMPDWFLQEYDINKLGNTWASDIYSCKLHAK